jgi:hypothetical protein
MTDTMSYTGLLHVERCPSCHVPFGIPVEMERWMREHPFTNRYCPNGHTWHYTSETEATKLKRRVAALESDAQHQREQRQHAERRLVAAKGVQTKLKKRIANGVCPCCKRHFGNLHQHMTDMHPGYAKESCS